MTTYWPVHPDRTRKRRSSEGPPHVLVIHTSEQTTFGTLTAEQLGAAVGQPATRDSAGEIINQASYHWGVDIDSIAAMVPVDDIAYHAPPNWRGEALCLCGRAARDWAGPDVWLQLDLAAGLAASILKRRGWPNRVLTVAEVQAGEQGMCGHVTISAAFHQTDHTDPGVTFPWSLFTSLIDGYLNPPAPPGDDDMATTARRVRMKGTANVFLIGAGPALNLTPELNLAYSDVPELVIEPHAQFRKSVLTQCGLVDADLQVGP
ncbi:MAG: N-acetylmuramoyl-L-alanine amidase [Ilumatobacteraceae bacterium]|nr:N-acetylmuramoyl-L-alanine amidase [Ilumatobacteraceae bacterium]